MENNLPKDLKYNFVFMFAAEDWWDAVFGEDMRNCPNVRIYKTAFNSNRFLQRLFHLHWAYSINCKFNLPFKSIWFKRMYRQDFADKKPLCFVYMGGNKIRFDGGFTDYVRRMSPDNRQVVYHADLISKKCLYNYSEVRDKVDLAITYDKTEAEKYHISLFEDVSFSKPIPDIQPAVFEQDVYFLGAVKDRYELILNTCRKLTESGLRCRFLVAGVPQEKQIRQEGIEYIQGISYEENIRNMLKSRAVLELVQGDSAGMTFRTREVLAYGRKLITNNQNAPRHLFSDDQLVVFSAPEDIEVKGLKDDYNPEDFAVDTSAVQWLYFIQGELEKEI